MRHGVSPRARCATNGTRLGGYLAFREIATTARESVRDGATRGGHAWFFSCAIPRPAKHRALRRHRLVAARARAGPTWESERSSTVARARPRRAAKGPRAGRWQVDRWEQLRPPTRLEPAAAGRSARSKETPGKKGGGTHESKGGFEPVPEEAVALAFFRVPRIKCFVQKVLI